MSFAAAKATIASDLLGRLDAVADGQSPTSDLAGIKFSAQRLRLVAREEYLMVLAIAAALEGDAATCDVHFNTAFAEFGYTPQLTINAYMAMAEMGRMADGLKLLQRGAEGFRDVESLETALGIFGGYGSYHDARKIIELLNRMTGRDYSSILNGVDQSMREAGVSESDLFDAVAHLRDFLRDKGYTRLSSAFHYDNTEERGISLVSRVDLPDSAEVVYQVEREANEAMMAAGLVAVERNAFVWYFMPNKEAPRARIVG